MTRLNTHLLANFCPQHEKENEIIGEGYRITLLTERLLRLEIGKYYDGATQTVWFRNFPKVQFSTSKQEEKLIISTERSEFYFDTVKKKFVDIVVDGVVLSVKDNKNLKGTCRTLDMRCGKVKLGDGVISKGGVAYLQDDSMALDREGNVFTREGVDTYVFAYGQDYRGAMQDFYRLCGAVPMIPRYVLGNWWSRYRAYTQEEYLEVIQKFKEKNIPLTVATVDMDWHWVKINEKFNTHFHSDHFGNFAGWTGYSWNTDLFPDHKEFLNTLHNQGLQVTLNLHPASGVRHYENAYFDMARAVGIDPATKKTVKFDLGNNKFINAYFDILHHTLEEEGVDFWWIDWQQGKKSTVAGLDPLWALNHLHYLDSSRNGKRGVILSRFAGVGSHRYPLGFSGDCIIRWKSLDFQPYMTATAGNIGYGWWSHDIGGHNFGVYDDELYLRWCQLGVFSPINRLHSSAHDLQGKEPWKHSVAVEKITSDFLRLRHRMIPYLYNAMYLANKKGIALCEPMYYSYPEKEESYQVKNEFFFGSELIVCPVTSKMLKSINLAKTKVWIPKGRYTDIFTGKIYNGEKYVYMFRDLDSIPVLAKEGAIIPLSADEGNSWQNPEKIELLIYRGNNTYSLYEDDGLTLQSEDGEYAVTDFSVKEEKNTIIFTASLPKYEEGVNFALPKNRTYILNFKDIKGGKVTKNGVEVKDSTVEIQAGDTVVVTDYEVCTNGDKNEYARNILSRLQGNNLLRMIKYFGLGKVVDNQKLLKSIRRRFGKDVYLAARETCD